MVLLADLTEPLLQAPSSNGSDSIEREREDRENMAFQVTIDALSSSESSWLCEQLLPIAFFPLVTIQFLILIQYNDNLCPAAVLFSVSVFIFTTTTYRQILSESQNNGLLVFALLPEISIFVTVIVATVTVNAILAYQTLLVSTILVASIAAWMTVVQLWQLHRNGGAGQEDEEADSISNLYVLDC